MKKLKKNNKGFSLVELIVVVLIMAIIAVSLAPQVMKWVNNSRIATDIQTIDSMVSSARLALTNSSAYDAVCGTSGQEHEITITKTSCEFTEGSGTAFETAFVNTAGALTNMRLKTDATVEITISTTGVVTWDETTAGGDKLTSTDLQ